MSRTRESVENRIHILTQRDAMRNAAIIKKLDRQLRKMK